MKRSYVVISAILFLIINTAIFAQASAIGPQEIPRGNFSPSVSLPLVQTAELDSLLSPLDQSDLSQFYTLGERIYRHDGDFSPRLSWDPDIARQLETLHSSRKNNFAIEVLMAIELPDSALQNNNLDLQLLNVLHTISTLKGLEYFSASRERLREFYITSTVINNPREQTPIPDPSYQSLEGSKSFYIRQEDASFGDNMYLVNSDKRGIRMSNITPMRYGPVQIAGAGDLELIVQIVRSGNLLFFYSATSVKAPRIFGMRTRVRNSFYNRIVALYNWFNREIGLTVF